ncbi:hypothetical protein PGB90_002634 [Kerria lacca]
MSSARLSNISSTQNCIKVYVQRDYSQGTLVRFQTHLPDELIDKLELSAFQYTVNQLNNFFEEAESTSCKTYCQGCCACLTAYLMFICVESHYEKVLKKVARFVTEQNEKIYAPRGLLLVNPAERGLRVIEILIINQPVISRA